MTGPEDIASTCVRGQVGHQEQFFHCKGGQALQQAAQGVGGVAVPGSVQKMTGHGTQCYSLVGVVVFGQRLDLMIFEVFSNHNDYDSIIFRRSY